MESQNTDHKTPKREQPAFSLRRLYYSILILMAVFFLWSNNRGTTKPVTWNEFSSKMLKDHDVEKLEVVNNEKVLVYIKKDKLIKEQYKEVSKGMFGNLNSGPHYFFTIGSVEVFADQLEKAQAGFKEDEKVNITYVKKGNWLQNIFSWIIPFIILIALWYFFMNRIAGDRGSGSSIFNFGKSKAVLFEKGKISSITFKEVAGYEEAKLEIMETVDFLKNPGKYTKLGAKTPKGILLVGPSGTGKTLMAKAVAGEADVPFFSLSGSEFIEMFVGVGASRVRDLFDRAKQKTPCIIFIDEIDTIGRIRGRAASFQVNDERESTLNQLLAEMDGFAPNTGVIVMAATNRADILDPALLRPGRFDRHIYLELPNKNEREAIFKVHLKPLKLDNNVDVVHLASQTPGFSGADIANVCNEAALIAARNKKEKIVMEDFFTAIDRIVSGLEKKTKIITAQEKKVISYHESGHAIVSWMLKKIDPLLKVSIIPRGRTLGSAWYLPEEHQILTESQLFERLCVMLGGRAAEELVMNEVSSGALDDLEKATKLSYTMIADLGLGEKLANISFHDSTGAQDSSFQKQYSEETSKIIDEEVRNLMHKAYENAMNILSDHKAQLDQLAELLLQNEIVYKVDLERILGKKEMETVGEKELVKL